MRYVASFLTALIFMPIHFQAALSLEDGSAESNVFCPFTFWYWMFGTGNSAAN